MLQSLSRESFFESFAQDNTEANMQHHMATSFALDKLTRELNNPHSEFYVAFLEAQPIGYIKLNFGEAQTELQDPKAVEIERIYVRKAFQGRKVGQLLFDWAMQIAKERQADYIWLGVWEKNSKAIAFYQKNGFITFDQHIFMIGDDPQTDWMMKRILK